MRPVSSPRHTSADLPRQGRASLSPQPNSFVAEAPAQGGDTSSFEGEPLSGEYSPAEVEDVLRKEISSRRTDANVFFPGRHLVGITDQPDFNPDFWPDLEVGGLDQEKLDTYLKRKKAVRLFFEGASSQELQMASGLGATWIGRLIRERCMLIHPDGRIYGWRGLVKYSRIASYTRKKKVKADVGGRGCAGALRSLLLTEPDLDRRFTNWILKSTAAGELGEVNKPLQRIWRWFLKELQKLGYEVRNEWPFTTEARGYQAVRNHVTRVLDSNPRRAARLVGGKPLADKLSGGDGVDRPIHRAYQRVEMDAHKLNGRFCILVPHPLGGHVPTIVRRLWVIAIIDVHTRAVLGYHLSRRPEVNKQDVLLTIKSALTRWQRMSLSMNVQPPAHF